MAPSPYITTHGHIHYVKPTPTPYPTAKCIKYALFMHRLPVGWALFLALVFGVIAVLSTNAVRRWTPGVVEEVEKAKGGDAVSSQAQAQSRDRSQDVESEEVGSGEDGVPLMSGDEEDGDGVEVGGKRGDDIPPPPYQAPAPVSMSISTSTPPAQAPASQPQPASESESVADSWLTPKKPEIEYTSAHLFVIGTSLLLLTIISLMLSALCIQAACFCGPG